MSTLQCANIVGNPTISASNITLTTANLTIGNTNLNGAVISVGNSSVNTQILQNSIVTLGSSIAKGLFYKADYTSVAFTKTANTTATVKAGTMVEVADIIVKFSVDTAITMPTLTAGTDYAVYVCYDNTIRADSSFSAPSGYTTSNSRKIGGFHYAPGSNASGTSGGDTTPQINQYSFWDLKFRPTASDPRGMTMIANKFWADIYLCNINHITNGTSKYNVAYARGTTPPLIPLATGGNGSTAFSTMTWWEANEVAQAYGKRLPFYGEFSVLAYGSTENTSIGSDQTNTVLNNAYTSKWGCIQSTGCLWTWGGDFNAYSDVTGGGSWKNVNGGRGQVYTFGATYGIVAAIFGGGWGDGSHAGSRASNWDVYPWSSGADIGSRFVCDHLLLV
jgi:hypothetical protein